MADPYWVTGDPADVNSDIAPLKYGPGPDEDAYVWDPNPDVTPSGGMAVLVWAHGGGNQGGSGFTSNTAVPFGFLEAVYGVYSFEYNHESTPVMLVTISYPMGMSLWQGMGRGARPLTRNHEPESGWRAMQKAVAWVKGKIARGEAPFTRCNKDLVYSGGISAGSTWAMQAAFYPPLPHATYGEDSLPKALILQHGVPDVNTHTPSVSSTDFMLNGHSRWYGQGLAQADAIVAAEKGLTVSSSDPAGVVGYHTSGFNELKRRMASNASGQYGQIPIVTAYPSNSRTETEPWTIAHSAAQGAALHSYLASTPEYTATHYHLANTDGNESNVTDALPGGTWAYAWSDQANWERMIQVMIDTGYDVSIEPDDAGTPTFPVALSEHGLWAQNGDNLMHQNTGTGIFDVHWLYNQTGDFPNTTTFALNQRGHYLEAQDDSAVALQAHS